MFAFSFYCLFVYSDFQASSIGLEYELKLVESFTLDLFARKYSSNNAQEDREIKIVLVHVDMASRSSGPTENVHNYTGLTFLHVNSSF